MHSRPKIACVDLTVRYRTNNIQDDGLDVKNARWFSVALQVAGLFDDLVWTSVFKELFFSA
jgi:hypothetical protein